MTSYNISATRRSLSHVADDKLIRLIYISHTTEQTRNNSDCVYTHILSESNTYNESKLVSGFLSYDDRFFIQCLEGAKQVVLDLMGRIFNDFRHKKVKVIVSKPIKERLFNDFQMRSLSLKNCVWNKEALSEHNLHQFIPFKPNNWPAWYVEYFMESMQYIDDMGVKTHDQRPDFKSIRVVNSEIALTNLSDKQYWSYFYLYLLLLFLALTILAIQFFI